MKMKLIVLFLLMFFLSFANANTQADSSKIFKTHSLQFRVNNFISFTQFKGYLLSYKRHFSDQSAFRTGMSVRVRKWEEKESNYYLYPDTTRLDQNLDCNDMEIEIMIEYLRYFNLKNDVKIFFGIGPRLLFDINNFDTDDISVSGDRYSYVKKYNYDHYQFGLTFSYGLEWFFMKNMSLHAEYGFNLSYDYRKYGRTEINKYPASPVRENYDLIKDSGFEFDDTGALLGISIYF